MKIGIVCYPTFGGSGVVATELGKALSMHGHQVHFVAYKQPARMDVFNNNLFYHEVNVSVYPLFDYPPYETSLTGHLVLSTLHTNSASGVLPRLLDMGIEPFLIASTIDVVMGQRLVRKVCVTCSKPMQATQAAVDMINRLVGNYLPKEQSQSKLVEENLGYQGLPIFSERAYTLYKGEGCADCDEGYKGRIGIYEIFEMNKDIEQLLLKEATSSIIQAQAQKDGMLTMQQDGVLKALTGITTLEEVSRVSADS